jgi:UDP-perosamine 4-acetyltransferase
MKLQVIGFGAGGHAKVLIEILKLNRRYKLVGLLDPKREAGVQVLDLPVLGNDEDLPKMMGMGIRHSLIGVGSVESSSNRQRLYEMAVVHGMQAVTSSSRQ